MPRQYLESSQLKCAADIVLANDYFFLFSAKTEPIAFLPLFTTYLPFEK